MDRIRVGVVGLNFGRHHVRTLATMEEADVVAVADRHPDVPGGLEAYAAGCGARAYRDGVEMLANEDLDAVSLCTSPRTRADLIAAAAERGVALFVEKPWAGTLAQAKTLAALCREHEATVMVAFSFRFHPAIVRLRALLDGELGAPWMLNGSYVFSWAPDPEGWLWDPDNGGGFLNENACHLFDAVCYLLGEPVSVTAEGINPMGMPSEHAAALTIRFNSGALAALTVGGIGAGAFHGFPRIDVIAEHGQAHLTGRDHIWEQVRWARRDQKATRHLTLPPEALGTTRYTAAFRHFFDCLRTGTSPSAGVTDGVRAVALATAVYASARSGERATLGDWNVPQRGESD
jgi:predicted dehydrogenase